MMEKQTIINLLFKHWLKKNYQLFFFISPAFINTAGYLTWDQVKEMSAQGMCFGTHGLHHPDFGILSPQETEQELSQSRNILEEQLNQKIVDFAYPYGNPNNMKDLDKPLLKKLDYKTAFCFGGNGFPKIKDPYRIPRYMVVDNRGITFFENLIEGFNF